MFHCVCLFQTNLIDEMSPIQMLKAVKNETEIEGMKRAHVSACVQSIKGSVHNAIVNSWSLCLSLSLSVCQVRDAVALCQYFCWLEAEVPKGTLDEVSAADKLEQFRRCTHACISVRLRMYMYVCA